MRTANSTVPMPTVPPSTQPMSEHGHLDEGAAAPRSASPGGRCSPVIRPSRGPGTEARADVEPRGEGDEQDAAEQDADLGRQSR